MRAFVLLSIFALSTADSESLEKEGSCVVDGGEAMSELMDSAMFIWAAAARCGHAGEEVKCEVDITSAMRSVNSMVNIVLKVVDKCGDLHMANKKCAFSAMSLSKATAGLAAASGGLVQKCPNNMKGDEHEHGSNWKHAASVLCVVNLKDTAKSLFTSVKALMKMKKGCKDLSSRKCAENALELVAALAGLGEYMSGAVGHCTHGNSEEAECSEQANMLIQELTKIAHAGTDMSKDCVVGETGLLAEKLPYPVDGLGDLDTTKLYSKDRPLLGISTNVLLVAFLPIACIVSFAGGRLYANHRSPNAARMLTPRLQVDVE